MTDGNDPAHPYKTNFGYNKGLTKREYFAGMALQGLASKIGFTKEDQLTAANAALGFADELIGALNDE